RRFDDIGFRDRGDFGAAGLLRVREGRFADAAAALRRDDAEIDREVVGDVQPLAADGVEVLGVLAEEHPVDLLARDAHGANVGELIEHFPHADVRALDIRITVALLGCVRGAFQRHVTLSDVFEDRIGNALHVLNAVFDRKSVDDSELNLPRVDLRLEKLFQDSLRFGRDRRTDAVAAENADDNRFDFREVLPGFVFFKPLDALKLLLEYFSEMLLRFAHRRRIYCHRSSYVLVE